MKLTVLATLLSSAAAFAPVSQTGRTSTAVNSLNGWVADESKIAYGLPGALPPFEDGFDPLGFAEGTPIETMKQWREAEVQHGRVGENLHMTCTSLDYLTIPYLLVRLT